MIVSNKLRDENTKLRKEIDHLREENIEVKQQLNALKRIEAVPRYSGGSSSTMPSMPQKQESSSYFPGVTSNPSQMQKLTSHPEIVFFVYIPRLITEQLPLTPRTRRFLIVSIYT